MPFCNGRVTRLAAMAILRVMAYEHYSRDEAVVALWNEFESRWALR
jgi:hypothetical protein